MPVRIVATVLFLLITAATVAACTTTPNQPPANSGREDRSR